MKEVDIEKRPDECQIDTPVECGENNRDTKPDISDRIYSLLNAAEKIAISLVKLNAKLRKKRKKQKKVYKKYGKLNKKTGHFMLKKKPKKAKKAKFYKRV